MPNLFYRCKFQVGEAESWGTEGESGPLTLSVRPQPNSKNSNVYRPQVWGYRVGKKERETPLSEKRTTGYPHACLAKLCRSRVQKCRSLP